jgi:hypothetical protein
MATISIVDSDQSGADLTTYTYALTVTGNPSTNYLVGFGGRAVAAGRTANGGVTVDGAAATLVHHHTVNAGGTSDCLGVYRIAAADLPNPSATELTVETTFSGAMIRAGVAIAETDADIEAAATAGTDAAADTDLVMNVNLNTADGGVILALFIAAQSGAANGNWGSYVALTEGADRNIENGTMFAAAAASNVAAGTPLTVSSTFAPAGGQTASALVGLAVAFAPAPAFQPAWAAGSNQVIQ